MQHTLDVRAFFFNAKTDYLPYYKTFTMTLDAEDPAEAILANIQKQNDNFAYPEEKLIFKINDLVVGGEERVGEIVAKLGTELQIDPVLSYRSNHCLIINDSDFMERFELLAPYANEEDTAYYLSMYALHYASETSKFLHDYVGDAILLLAYRMISNGSEYTEQILEAISDPYDGLAACEYNNNLFRAEFHSKEIDELNEMVTYPKPNTLLNKVSETLSKKALCSFDKESIEGVHIACYAGNSSMQDEVNATILANAAKIVGFQRSQRLAGTSLIGKQDNLAYLKAGTMLLNALDAGAEMLVVVKKTDLEMFRTNFASIQKRIGREIRLPLLSTEELSALCTKKEVA
jgi:hypothetical protein